MDNLLTYDPFFVLADFDDYIDSHNEVNRRWTNREEWTKMSVLNTARSGFFSSDRSIRDYCKGILGISEPGKSRYVL